MSGWGVEISRWIDQFILGGCKLDAGWATVPCLTHTSTSLPYQPISTALEC